MRVDDLFLNFSYLSEKWLGNFLEIYKAQCPEGWTSEREEQLKDEKRHEAQLLFVLKKRCKDINYDLKYSIQEGVYKAVGLLDMGAARTPIQAEIVQNILERRASFLYRIYLGVGTDEGYKKVIREILNDEKKHLNIDNCQIKSHEMFQVYSSLDRQLFIQIAEVYGSGKNRSESLMQIRFWDDLFSGNLAGRIYSKRLGLTNPTGLAGTNFGVEAVQ